LRAGTITESDGASGSAATTGTRSQPRAIAAARAA
jgi:hypothetical protein